MGQTKGFGQMGAFITRCESRLKHEQPGFDWKRLQDPMSAVPSTVESREITAT